MNDLVQIRRNDVYTTSLVIAEGANVTHRKVKETIRKHSDFLKTLGLLGAYPTESSGGRPETFYLLNEQQATFLITLLKNTETVVAFKLELVRQFYAMRKFILEKQSEEWKTQRSDGKMIRREETDVIRQLVEYAKRQGSQNADRLYITYSTLAQKTAGITSRETATVVQLNTLAFAETVIMNVIAGCMAQEVPYKEIYPICKERLREVAVLLSYEPQVQKGELKW